MIAGRLDLLWLVPALRLRGRFDLELLISEEEQARSSWGVRLIVVAIE